MQIAMAEKREKLWTAGVDDDIPTKKAAAFVNALCMNAPKPRIGPVIKSISGFVVLAKSIKAGPNKNITSAVKWFFLIGKISDKIPMVGFAISAAKPKADIT